jgi:superkiller protein 3
MKRLAVVLGLFLLPSCAGITCSQGRHRAIRYMNQGVKLFTEGLHAQALRELQAAVREDDNYALAHYNLAKVFQELKRWDEAQRHLNRVVTLVPNDARYHYDLGMCYQNLERLDLAQKEYEAALQLNPKLYVAHFRLGTIHMATDKPKEADAAFRKAIEINPRFIKPFVKLSLLYLNYDYPEAAMQVLQAGLAINEDSAEAHNMLGVSHQFLKQYDKAIASFKKALELKGDLLDAIYNLGMTFAAADRKKEAVDALTRFTKAAAGKADVDPDFVRAANDKISELSGAATEGGGGSGQDAPPTRVQ